MDSFSRGRLRDQLRYRPEHDLFHEPRYLGLIPGIERPFAQRMNDPEARNLEIAEELRESPLDIFPLGGEFLRRRGRGTRINSPAYSSTFHVHPPSGTSVPVTPFRNDCASTLRPKPRKGAAPVQERYPGCQWRRAHQTVTCVGEGPYLAFSRYRFSVTGQESARNGCIWPCASSSATSIGNTY